ncbi:MAG: CCA tRNA nucleotidyltransferase [Lachnospiraceae bacterium]|nr:CCA tRNA nucleotidyltransferase [Lachnospiraceae bacterium]
MKIRMPEGAAKILEELRRAGYEAYVVGGCVRDSILGRDPQDWDITTSALPEQVKAVFRRTVDTGIKHGTVTVLLGGSQYEVTTYRIDGDYKDGRHPENVSFVRELSEDLRRRDFTINAMAYSEETGLVDLFEGIRDIQERRIRAVGDPAERFSEDALRIMRAVRFSAQLGYEIDPATCDAIRRQADGLRRISAERIRVELDKLLTSEHPEALRTAYELGILKEFLPELVTCMDCGQNNPHHCYTVGEHIIHAVCAADNDRILRLAMLLHDIGKPLCKTTDEDGTDHFHGHAALSARIADQILRRLKYDNDTRGKVVRLVEYHGMDMEYTPESVRRGIVKVGVELFPLLMKVKQADGAAQSSYRADEKREQTLRWMALYTEILERGDPLQLSDLAVKGKDLIAAGMKPSAGLGAVLEEMLDDVLAAPEHNTKEYLMKRFCPTQE